MDSLGAVCVAQFIKSKALEGGLDGVKKLAEIPHIDTLLRACGEARSPCTLPDSVVYLSLRVIGVYDNG